MTAQCDYFFSNIILCLPNERQAQKTFRIVKNTCGKHVQVICVKSEFLLIFNSHFPPKNEKL